MRKKVAKLIVEKYQTAILSKRTKMQTLKYELIAVAQVLKAIDFDQNVQIALDVLIFDLYSRENKLK